VLAIVKDDVLYTINSLEILGIIYLAVAVSMLRERISKMEGRNEGKEKQAELNHMDK
jgi:hypothetical protein